MPPVSRLPPELVAELVGARLALPPGRVDTAAGFYDLGLASADLVSMVPELEERLALSLSPTVVFEHRSPADLAAWLDSQTAGRRSAATPPESGGVPEPSAPVGGAEGPPPGGGHPAVHAAVVEELAAVLEVGPHEIAEDQELGEYGLDLTARAVLAERLGARLGAAPAAASLADHLTVGAVADRLAARVRPAAEPSDAASAHPLLHRVVRQDGAMEYRTRFSGAEPFLRDHRVRGDRILPAVAQLEMARAAVEDAAQAGPGTARLDDVVWLRPARCGAEGLELRVAVREAPGGWDYTLHAVVVADGKPDLCGRGRASLREGAATAPPLARLRERCSRRTVPPPPTSTTSTTVSVWTTGPHSVRSRNSAWAPARPGAPRYWRGSGCRPRHARWSAACSTRASRTARCRPWRGCPRSRTTGRTNEAVPHCRSRSSGSRCTPPSRPAPTPGCGAGPAARRTSTSPCSTRTAGCAPPLTGLRTRSLAAPADAGQQPSAGTRAVPSAGPTGQRSGPEPATAPAPTSPSWG